MAGLRLMVACGMAMCLGGSQASAAPAVPLLTVQIIKPLPSYWQAQGCKHRHSLRVAYRQVRRRARHGRRRGVRHYARCVGSREKSRRVLRVYRRALARSRSKLVRMVREANRIDRARYPYVLGGGHGSFRGPYDCSGAVSAVLRAGGVLRAPMTSGGFVRWGRRGRGTVTVYANGGHVFMSIKGRFFGTSRSNPGGGAGWIAPRSAAGFSVVHVPLR